MGQDGQSEIDLADVHFGGRTNDTDLDVRPILRMAQPTQHPRILNNETTPSEPGCDGWVRARWLVNKELTMSVLSMSLVVAMSPSEKEGSAVLSIRIIAVFACV
jgi:hypothetical protein